ncbi:MAG: DUF2059 domain-containing protein [Acidobacteriota bacterium]
MRRIGMLVVAAALSMGMGPVFGQVTADQPKALAEVPASEQPTDAQLAKLFEVMRLKEQMAATTKMLPMVMQQQMRQQFAEMEKDHPEMRPTTNEQREQMTAIMGRYMTKAISLYSPDEMVADMGAIYKKHMTGADVEAVTAFYSTPAGQHMLDMSSAVMTEFMPTVMQKMQGRMRPLILEMTQELTTVMKAPAAKTPETGTKPEQK